MRLAKPEVFFFFSDILISGNGQFHNPSSSINLTCSSNLSVQAVHWLDRDGVVLLSSVEEQQLDLSIENALNNTIFTCEVTVVLATGLTTIARSTDVLSYFTSKFVGQLKSWFVTCTDKIMMASVNS